MAIFHLSVKTVSRGSGVSAKARHDYIRRRGKFIADAAEVLFAVDGNMPEWAAADAGAYWRGADLYERANGRLFKQIEFALPIELAPDAQRAAALELVQAVTQTAAGPLPFSMAIHAGHGRGNPHVHLMVSERVNDGTERGPALWFSRAGRRTGGKEGGAKKTRALKSTAWLLWLRQAWETIANRALAAAGVPARIDCRTLEAQGIRREPQRHLGPARAAMSRKRGSIAADADRKTFSTYGGADLQKNSSGVCSTQKDGEDAPDYWLLDDFEQLSGADEATADGGDFPAVVEDVPDGGAAPDGS